MLNVFIIDEGESNYRIVEHKPRINLSKSGTHNGRKIYKI